MKKTILKKSYKAIPFIRKRIEKYYRNRYKSLFKLDEQVKLKKIIVEISNFCNAACKLCPHKKMKRKKLFMSNDLFEVITQRCVDEKIENIGFGGIGEFLLDKDFLTKCIMAKSKSLNLTSLTTNALLLNKDIASRIMEMNFFQIGFSLNAYSREMFELMDKGLDYDRVHNNIECFLSLREKINNATRISIQMVVSKKNSSEQKPFLGRWKKKLRKGDKLTFLYAHNWGGGEEEPNSSRTVNRFKLPCSRLWDNSLTIRSDGKGSICCMDYENSVNIGSVEDISLNSIWNSKTLNNIRKLHIGGNFNAVSVCANCTDNDFLKLGYKVIMV